ncbi:hypothetical protein [Gemelliphila palaticanis]|uniref:Uncharacterized protein n=1 Tax=Gemelliphila palaticanis TaxID=81950 RepID=A0ABX2SXP2_9BACL|nr:hypothetical protein [Gemella palaticanis]MBF0715100.1 hypothetical protein [Gemella palaticanis]NYS47030.1 hypothetical protein [Gemella palaticanis]
MKLTKRKNFKLLPIFLLPLILSYPALADNNIKNDNNIIDITSDNKYSNEFKDAQEATILKYSKKIHYISYSDSIPETKYYAEFNSRYQDWFGGELKLVSSRWIESKGYYVLWYSGALNQNDVGIDAYTEDMQKEQPAGIITGDN